jgi:hypothetical protein
MKGPLLKLAHRVISLCCGIWSLSGHSGSRGFGNASVTRRVCKALVAFTPLTMLYYQVVSLSDARGVKQR